MVVVEQGHLVEEVVEWVQVCELFAWPAADKNTGSHPAFVVALGDHYSPCHRVL